MRSMRWSALALSVGAIACSPMTMEPTLEVSVTPKTIRNDGQAATISVTATDEQGKAGTGSVRIKAGAGSLSGDGVTVMLSGGKAESPFTCPATDMACKGLVRVNVEWTTAAMKLVTGSSSVTVIVPTPDAGADAGVDGGNEPVDAGVDAGMDAGFDAGMDAGVDAGLADGGGLTLSTDKTLLVAGVGELATFTATVTAPSGAPAVNQAVSFSTTLGTFAGGNDAGTTCMTNAAGVCTAQLTAAAGVNGNATVTADSSGYRAQNSIRILSVSQVRFVDVTCTQTAMNCNLMGIQGSGFNETASVKFQVLDASNAPVAGVPVTFTLIGGPAGTSVDPMQTTDAMGNVTATVRSGRTVGTFSVRAASYGITVESPTIGVRGAKPSNRAFTLQCNRVNISAYNSPTPPRPVTVTCTVGLTDRYNNPVGTGTSVRLQSEAGAVPNNVATTPFMPGGANEGRGTFTFATDQGNYPPQDVPPFAADTTQYPFPRNPEPFWNDGPLVPNPRDGLVTIIAYLQGEEDFRDNNNNGTWDTGEQFIDQGEPLLDTNDNNVYDVGEQYIDSNMNNRYDGPNGVWDATTQIWTEVRLLYTGATFAPQSRINLTSTRLPGSSNYGLVPVGATINLNAFLPDRQLNRITSGSSVTARLSPATRGSLGIITTTGLDDYGFRLERRLLAASGTADCTPTTQACSYFVRIGGWGEGAIATISITGGTAPAMATVEACVVDSTVDGITVTTQLFGTVE